MKINKIMLMGMIILSTQQGLVCSAGKEPVRKMMEKKTGSAANIREPKRTPKLNPTETKVRVFLNEKNPEAQPVGVEVIVCQGNCSGRSSIPYTKGVQEMQEKALKLVASEGLEKKMQS